jgi:DNA-binding transcriptional LysR family regulator
MTDEQKTMYLMADMSGIDVRAMNLNLLPALEALLVEGSVSGAARRAHVSQSAMSHSLAKLRELFGDPLFLPAGRRLVATPRAVELLASLPRALDQLGLAVAAREPFRPGVSRRVFRVATVDYFELTTLPYLLAYLAKHAPLVRVEIERFAGGHLTALVAGEVDLALVSAAIPPPVGVRRAALYDDPFSVIVRPGHPLVGRKLDLDRYLSLGHVLVSVEGRSEGVVDRALAKLGKSRSVSLRVPHFISAPLAVAESDLICTIASSVAQRSRELFGLRVLPPPLELPPASVVALWSRRHDQDPAAKWFRELFIDGRATSPFVRALRRAQRV